MFGVFCIFLGVISLLLRKFVDLFGPPELHSANTEMEAVEI
jgi:hypothetical protein